MLRNVQYSGKLHPAAVSLVKLVALYFFVLHLTACLYWYPLPRTCHEKPAAK